MIDQEAHVLRATSVLTNLMSATAAWAAHACTLVLPVVPTSSPPPPPPAPPSPPGLQPHRSSLPVQAYYRDSHGFEGRKGAPLGRQGSGDVVVPHEAAAPARDRSH